jgi:hypothetical protein
MPILNFKSTYDCVSRRIRVWTRVEDAVVDAVLGACLYNVVHGIPDHDVLERFAAVAQVRVVPMH